MSPAFERPISNVASFGSSNDGEARCSDPPSHLELNMHGIVG